MATTKSGQHDELFDVFIKATTLKGVLTTFRKICHILEITPGSFNDFYPAFKRGITGGCVKLDKNWKSQSIFSKIEKKANNKVYHLTITNPSSHLHPLSANDHHRHDHHHHGRRYRHFNSQVSTTTVTNGVLKDHNCLVIGGGPCGLRTAIELQLLGARHVVVIEKRDRLSRNNVLHLWPFVIHDLKSMAGKKFYGKFCAGSIDHVSIRQLQLMLLKFALILGVEFIENITFEEICPRNLMPFNINGNCSQVDAQSARAGCNPSVAVSPSEMVVIGEEEAALPGCQLKRKLGPSSSANDDPLLVSGLEQKIRDTNPSHKGDADDGDPITVERSEVDGNVCFSDGGKKSKNSLPLSHHRHEEHRYEGRENKDGDGGEEDDRVNALPSPPSHDNFDRTNLKKKPCGTKSNHEASDESSDDTSSSSENEIKEAAAGGLLKTNSDEEEIKLREESDQTRGGKPQRNGNEESACFCCCHLHHHKEPLQWKTSDDYVGALAHFAINSKNPATASPYVDYDNILSKLHSFQFDIVLGADGRRNTLSDNFPRKEFRGRLAIAITANFVNTHTLTEAQIPEISGISFIYNQQLFRTLHDETGIDLENICYYKDDTHYFVMTAKKSSLLSRNVLYQDFNDTNALLAPGNINRMELLSYARDAAKWTTGLDQKFALNHYGEPDVAMFDFTSMYAAENACRVKKIQTIPNCVTCTCDAHHYECGSTFQDTSEMSVPPTKPIRNAQFVKQSLLLVGLVGDSLLEPFWPTGSGCGRGFLSAMDSAWMAHEWATKSCRDNPDSSIILDVLREREAIYRLLAQTKSENLSQNYSAYTLNPVTRYPNFNSSTMLPLLTCKHLLYDDVLPPPSSSYNETKSTKKRDTAAKRARRATIAGTTVPSLDLGSPDDGNEKMLEEEEFDPCRASTGYQDSGRIREKQVNERIGQLAEKLVASRSSDKNKSSGIECDLEETFADFEQNYQMLMTSSSSSAIPSSNSTAVLSSSLNSRSAFQELSMSPSVSNLATMTKSRAKEIEVALRHRRQQQSLFTRSGSELDLRTNRHSAPVGQGPTEISNHKSRVAWFLEQQQNQNHVDHSCSSTSLNEREKDPQKLGSKIKDLEAKLQAASGLNCFKQPLDVQQENNMLLAQKKIISTKGSSNVISAATNLEKILDRGFQDKKLKEKAQEYRKKTLDIKVVGKMTTETDWNKKCWEERLLKAEDEKKLPTRTSPTPRPTALLQIFEGKKNEINSKLEETKSSHRLVKKSPNKIRSGLKDEWIAMLKGELTERSTTAKEPKKQVVVKAPFKSPFKDEDEKIRQNTPKSIPNWQRQSVIPPSSLPLSPPAKSNSSSNLFGLKYQMKSRCVRCRQQIAIVDRVLISGCLLHRSCLTCSKCGITLRLSEFKSNEGASSSSSNGPLQSSSSGFENNFNYMCILCSKNKVNNQQSVSNGKPSFGNGFHPLPKSNIPLNSTQHHYLSSSSPSINKLNGSKMKPMEIKSRDLGKLPPKSPTRAVHKDEARNTALPPEEEVGEECVDEYELRLKERMKWKANFLMNNNNIDLGSIFRANEEKENRMKQKPITPTSPHSPAISHKVDTCTVDGGGGVSGSSRNGIGLNQEIETKAQPTATSMATGAKQEVIEGLQKVGKRTKSEQNDDGKYSSFSSATSSSSPSSDPSSSPDKNFNNLHETISSPKINERIEYENTSLTYELLDDDEMTKLLNLESDRWASDPEEDDDDDESQEGGSHDASARRKNGSGASRGRGPVTTHELSSPLTNSSSWQKSSDDSTSNDFDSDEFDNSEAVTSPSKASDSSLNRAAASGSKGGRITVPSTTRFVQGQNSNVTGNREKNRGRKSKPGDSRKNGAINQAESGNKKSSLGSYDSSPMSRRREMGGDKKSLPSSTTTSPSLVPEISIEQFGEKESQTKLSSPPGVMENKATREPTIEHDTVGDIFFIDEYTDNHRDRDQGSNHV